MTAVIFSAADDQDQSAVVTVCYDREVHQIDAAVCSNRAISSHLAISELPQAHNTTRTPGCNDSASKFFQVQGPLVFSIQYGVTALRNRCITLAMHSFPSLDLRTGLVDRRLWPLTRAWLHLQVFVFNFNDMKGDMSSSCTAIAFAGIRCLKTPGLTIAATSDSRLRRRIVSP